MATDRLSARGRKTQLSSFVTGIIIVAPLLDLFGKVGLFILAFVLHVIVFHVIIYGAVLNMNYPQCEDCALSASFFKGAGYGEHVELTVRKETVVVEEIKRVGLRSRRAQFIYDRNYNRKEEINKK